MLVGRYLKIEVHVNIDLCYTDVYFIYFKIYHIHIHGELDREKKKSN